MRLLSKKTPHLIADLRLICFRICSN